MNISFSFLQCFQIFKCHIDRIGHERQKGMCCKRNKKGVRHAEGEGGTSKPHPLCSKASLFFSISHIADDAMVQLENVARTISVAYGVSPCQGLRW